MYETLLNALILAGSLLGRTLPFMVLGVIIAEFIINLGFVNKISFIARPITNFSHLNHECGASFLMAFGSPPAANAMLAQYYEKKLISKKEMFLASLLNSFPVILLHWRSMLPVLIPLLGSIGLVYFLILILSGTVKTLLIMIASRFLLPARFVSKLTPPTKTRLTLKEALYKSLRSSRRTIKRIIIITVPTMFFISILIEAGFFTWISAYLKGVGAYLPVPAGGIGIIASAIGHPIAAYTISSNLLAVGEISAKGIILSLLIGTIFSSPVSMLRDSMPSHVGIFGPKTGLQIVLLSSVIRNGITIIIIVLLALFW